MRFSLLFALAVLFCLPLPGQQTQTPPIHRKKVVTPAQRAYQAAWTQWFAERVQRRKAAQAILNRVPPQPLGGDCPKAMSTYDQVQCLGALDSTVASDESAFVAALRDLASHWPPSFPGEKPMPGALSPQREAAMLDSLEGDWQNYRKAGRNAAHAEGDGGTIAPVLALSADLFLLRSHLKELAEIYGETLLSKH